jgi:hypothetical protein
MDNKSDKSATTTAPASAPQAAADSSMPAQVPAQTQPMPTPPMVQTPMPAAPQMQSGGVTGSVNDFFRGVNWVDVGILMLGTAALYYTIYYYRIKIKAQKRELADMGNKVDMMEAKVSAIQKQQQEQNQSKIRKRRATF